MSQDRNQVGEITLDQVVEAVESVLPRRKRKGLTLTADTRIEDLDIASIDLARAITRLEDQLGAQVDTTSLYVETIGDLLQLRVVRPPKDASA